MLNAQDLTRCSQFSLNSYATQTIRVSETLAEWDPSGHLVVRRLE